MKVLLAGGTGFLGSHLAKALLTEGHQVYQLTRKRKAGLPGAESVVWDGKTAQGWGSLVNEMEAVVNLTGLSLNNWPWTEKKKRMFLRSRVEPGRALVVAIEEAEHRPSIFVQISGINYYGLRGTQIVGEDAPPGDDFLAQLAVDWEHSTASIESLGVRRVVCRTAVVLARDAILFQLMTLPARLFFGGRLGRGDQALPWIHLEDVLGAIQFLIENEGTGGAYNLIAPNPVSNADFMRAIAQAYRRPYWFHIPAFLLRLVLGEMSVLIAEGRYAEPRRLLQSGYTFHYPTLNAALDQLDWSSPS